MINYPRKSAVAASYKRLLYLTNQPPFAPEGAKIRVNQRKD